MGNVGEITHALKWGLADLRCARCRKRVDEVVVSYTPWDDNHHVEARCHGKRERVTVRVLDLTRATAVRVYEAFAGDSEGEGEGEQ